MSNGAPPRPVSMKAECWCLCWPHGLQGILSCRLIVPIVRRTWFRRCASGVINRALVLKAKRGQKLNVRKVVLNTAYSRHRCRVEHVFGLMRNDMPEHEMRWIGKVLAKGWIGMRNLSYNCHYRLCYLETVAEV